MSTRVGETGLPSPWGLFLRSRLWVAVRLLSILLLLGSCGFWVLGRLHYHGVLQPHMDVHWGPLDCIYMTVITVSTIGYGEVIGQSRIAG